MAGDVVVDTRTLEERQDTWAAAVPNFVKGARARIIRHALDELLLPEPMKDEIVKVDGGFLLPIAPAGCMLRVIDKDRLRVFIQDADRYDRILQPLGSIGGGAIAVSLYPGILTPAFYRVKKHGDKEHIREDEKADRLSTIVAEDGYFFGDSHPFNIGYLPGTQTVKNPDGFSVVLDLGAIRLDKDACARLKESTSWAEKFLAFLGKWKQLLEQKRPTPVQDALYGDLKQAFAQAVGGTEKQKQDFWALCGEGKRNGRLVTDWEKESSYPHYFQKLSKLTSASRAYEIRLAQSSLFAPR